MPRIATMVLEETNNPGTGTFALAGAIAGRRPWSSAFSSGDLVYYFATDGTQTEWGIGTYTSGSPGTVSRDTVLGNTANTMSRLNFTTTTYVYSESPAEQSSGAMGSAAFANPSVPTLGGTVGSISLRAPGSSLRVDLAAGITLPDTSAPSGAWEILRCTLSLYATASDGTASGAAIVQAARDIKVEAPGAYAMGCPLDLALVATGLASGATYLVQLDVTIPTTSDGIKHTLGIKDAGIVWLSL